MLDAQEMLFYFIIAFGAQRRTQTNFAAGLPVYWDVCDPEGVKVQDFYVSAGLAACLGSFSAPSRIHREKALWNAFLKCMSLVSLLEVNK